MPRKNTYSRKLLSKRKNREGKIRYEFQYIDNASGKKVSSQEKITELNKLRIPPAYEDVVINKNENHKVRAYGFDEKDRKQVIYNPKFREKQQKLKHKHMIEFGRVLPQINSHLDKMLQQTNDDKLRIIALVIRLIQICDFRIGNDDAFRESGNRGLTTLNSEHIKLLPPNQIEIKFIGKKGVENHCKFRNTLIYKHLEELKKQTPKNQPIFQYEELEDDTVSSSNQDVKKIKASDVNEFLKIYGDNISSKNFRTWNANTHFLESVKNNLPDSFKDLKAITKKKKYIKDRIADVADKLHNTSAVCKKEYLNPDLLKYFENKFMKAINQVRNLGNKNLDTHYLDLLENQI